MVRLSALCNGFFTPQEISLVPCLLDNESIPGPQHGWIMSMKDTNDTIGNWTHNLSARSLVPQPPMLVHPPVLNVSMTHYKSIFREVFNSYFFHLGKKKKKYPRTCHYTFFHICAIFMLQTYNSFIYKFHIHLLHKAIFMLLCISATIVAVIKEPQYYQDISSVLHISMVIFAHWRDEKCALLGYYTVSYGKFLPMFQDRP